MAILTRKRINFDRYNRPVKVLEDVTVSATIDVTNRRVLLIINSDPDDRSEQFRLELDHDDTRLRWAFERDEKEIE